MMADSSNQQQFQPPPSSSGAPGSSDHSGSTPRDHDGAAYIRRTAWGGGQERQASETIVTGGASTNYDLYADDFPVPVQHSRRRSAGNDPDGREPASRAAATAAEGERRSSEGGQDLQHMAASRGTLATDRNNSRVFVDESGNTIGYHHHHRGNNNNSKGSSTRQVKDATDGRGNPQPSPGFPSYARRLSDSEGANSSDLRGVSRRDHSPGVSSVSRVDSSWAHGRGPGGHPDFGVGREGTEGGERWDGAGRAGGEGQRKEEWEGAGGGANERTVDEDAYRFRSFSEEVGDRVFAVFFG